ncbi:MAG: hypothetical protein EPN84_12595 [Legionella sp.]|nr:MAG: hypothetical protein EPN84_12595 [Legionella sp.]
MPDFRALIELYLNNPNTPYNPKPLFEYLRHSWQESIGSLASNDFPDCKDKWGALSLLLDEKFDTISLKHIDWLQDLCSSLLLEFTTIKPTTSPESAAKIKHWLNMFSDLFAVYKEYIKKSIHPPFSDDYDSALILPNGYCFTLSEKNRIAMTPDPSLPRSSLHAFTQCDGVFIFAMNAETKPSLEVLGFAAVQQMAHKKTHLFPAKSPAVILTRTLEKNGEPSFTSKLLQLSKKVEGVTLDNLILAKDVFTILTEDKKAQIELEIKKDITPAPPQEEKVSLEVETKKDTTSAPAQEKKIKLSDETKFAIIEVLKKINAEKPVSERRIHHEHRDLKPVLTKLISQHHTSRELHRALKVYELLPKEAKEAAPLDKWLTRVIPYLNALNELIQVYGQNMENAAFLRLLTTALDNINPQHVQLLGLASHMLFDHDAVGSNFIVKLNTLEDALYHDLYYIDGDHRMRESALVRKHNIPRSRNLNSSGSSSSTSTSTSSTTSTPTASKHFTQINSILGIFKHFQNTPLSTRFVRHLKTISPEEVFFDCLNAARESERPYQRFLDLFDISTEERFELKIPVGLLPSLVYQSFETFQKVWDALPVNSKEPVTTMQILNRCLPHNARMCEYAYKKVGEFPSCWRDLFVNHGHCFEELFSAVPINDKASNEIGADSSRRGNNKTLPFFLRTLVLDWIKYSQLSRVSAVRLIARIEATLVKDGIITEEEFKPIKEAWGKAVSNDDADIATSPQSGPRFFNKVNSRLHHSGEMEVTKNPPEIQRSTSQISFKPVMYSSDET